MIIGIVRYPQFAPKPRGIEALLGPLLPHTPKWLQHITMHQVWPQSLAAHPLSAHCEPWAGESLHRAAVPQALFSE